jgi:hypothetical protein
MVLILESIRILKVLIRSFMKLASTKLNAGSTDCRKGKCDLACSLGECH